jgi:3-keto-disaccharide hydrolase
MLQQSGFPAGSTELPLNVSAMKSMKLAGTLGEAGFERIFNGRDFTGLKFLIGPNCRPAPAGCGRTDPGSTFWVENGEVVTNGKIQGYMYTEKKYLNFTLRFEFRHVPPADWDPEGDYFDGNSGYLLFVTEHGVWPKGIEIQGNHMNPLHALGMDTVLKLVNDDVAMRRAKRPAGQWQSAEIVSTNGQVRSYLNGTLVSTITEHEFKAPGHIGFQSEGAELHWRNIRIKAE